MAIGSMIAGGIGIAAAAGVGVSMLRAATTYKVKPMKDAEGYPDEKADVERYINNLSKAIQIPTISNFNDDLVDWSKFDEFHAFLEEAYPLIHSKLEKTIISKKSLVFHWKSAHPEKEPICMLAHQDVVPVSKGTEEDWTYPAFSGTVADGFVWGRGALDIKNHLIGVMEAVETSLSGT